MKIEQFSGLCFKKYLSLDKEKNPDHLREEMVIFLTVFDYQCASDLIKL